MRCGSAGTCTTSGSTPAALCTCRFEALGSAAAASRAHESSGRRSFPSTPAPAIWVVGVTRDRAGVWPAGAPDPQPLHATTTAAVTAVAAASRAGLMTPNNTRQTLTFGQRGDRERGGAGRSGSPPFGQRGDRERGGAGRSGSPPFGQRGDRER